MARANSATTWSATFNFTLDSRQCAYVAVAEGETFTVVGQQEAEARYDSVGLPPGEKLLFDTRKKFHYLAVMDNKIYLVEEDVD